MFKPRITLDKIISANLLEKMHWKALEILQSIGMKVTSKPILERIEGVRGFKIEEDRVKIDPQLMESLVEEYKSKVGKRDPDIITDLEEITLLGTGYPGCTHIIDLETDKLRPLTTKDAIDATKLIDSLYDWGLRGGAPGAPQDVSPNYRRILQCKIGYEYSRSASCAPFENYVEAEYIRRMANAIGQKFYLDVYVVSPLRLEGVSVDRVVPFLEKGSCDGMSVGSMPLAGATAPVYPIGAITQGIAESLGGYAILHEAYPKIPIWFGMGAFHFDLKHGNIVFGSPEQILLDLIGIIVDRFYGVPRIGGVRSFRTMAKTVDAQAEVEKAASATVGVLTGPGKFNMSGVLSLDEIFSPVQLIIDCEIAHYLSKLARGLDLSEEELDSSMEVIQRCALKGSFLTDKTTLTQYRRIYWYPRLFDYSLLHTSRREMKSLTDRAKEMARKKIAEHNFQLEESKKRKLEKIYREAIKKIE